MTRGGGVISIIDDIPTSSSEGPVFEDSDSVFSDLPSPSDLGSGPEIMKDVVKEGQRKVGDESSKESGNDSSVRKNVPPPRDESRNDILFLPEEEEEDVDQTALFEDELRESARNTRITVNFHDASLVDKSTPLVLFRNETLQKKTAEKRDSYIPSALYADPRKYEQPKKHSDKSHNRTKSVDDSILDKVITVSKDVDEAEEEDSLFDSVSQLTKDQVFEKRQPVESTLKALIESSGAALDSAMKNIMENTNFSAEGLFEDTGCNFLTPFDDIAACGDMTQSFWAKDEATIEEESVGPNEKTFIDFGRLQGIKVEETLLPETPSNSQGILDIAACGDMTQSFWAKDEATMEEESVEPNEKTFIDFGCLQGIKEEETLLPETPSNYQGILESIEGKKVVEHTLVEPFAKPAPIEQHVVTCKLSKGSNKATSLSLVESKNGILISRIDPKSELAGSELQLGMVMLTVNGSLCPDTVAETYSLIKSTSGDIEIAAAFRGAKVNIAPPASRRGVGEPAIESSEADAVIYKNSDSKSESLSFFASFLSRFWCDTAANDFIDDQESIVETEKPAVEEKTASGSTQSVSESSPVPEKPVHTRTFSVQRISWEDPIGLKLSRGKGGIVVAEITNYSPFRFTGLRTGMRIHEINGIACPGTLIVAENFLKSIERNVELVVTSEEKQPAAKPVLFYSEI